jgi:hypothetical protein
MGSIRQILQAQPKNIKKLSKHHRTKNFTKKTMFRTLKSSTQNPKKIIETPNQPIRTKIFPKKLCFVR